MRALARVACVAVVSQVAVRGVVEERPCVVRARVACGAVVSQVAVCGAVEGGRACAGAYGLWRRRIAGSCARRGGGGPCVRWRVWPVAPSYRG